jgi:hypothetical protein
MLALVSGALANKPYYGGEAWVRTTWLRGLERLGFETCFVEQIASDSCVDHRGDPAPFDTSANRRFFEDTLAAAAPRSRTALILDGGPTTAGLPYENLLELAADAELLVNVSGHLTLEPIKRAPRRRAFVDVDPGFTQIWEAERAGGAHLADHDAYFTVGENIGSRDCSIPTAAIDWHPLPPPVVLDDWPVTPRPDPHRFTTVAGWRSPLGELSHDGVTFPGKHHEWRRMIDVPRRAAQEFEIALDIHPGDEGDLEALWEHGWRIVDPREVAGNPLAFRDYVQGSGAEFSVAHGVYVETRSGWLSDRTVRYLASGRPALVQDTGIAQRYPVGQGLLTFSTAAEAVARAAAIVRDHAEHVEAARALAAERFDSDRVISRLLGELGVG